MSTIRRSVCILLLVGAAVIMGVFTSGCLKESQLYVQGMDVGIVTVSPMNVTINVTTSVQNTEGFGSGKPGIHLTAYSTETGLVVSDRTDPFQAVGWGGSASVSQEMVLPRSGSYRLVAVVYEGDKRKARGEITVNNLERLTPDSEKTGLSIEEIDFSVKKVSGDYVTLQADMYLENNDGTPTGPFDIEVKAKELDAQLMADKQSTSIGDIAPGKIVVTNVTLTVPDQYNYHVEVLVWKNGTILKRGEGNVLLKPGTVVNEGSQFVTKKIETGKFVSSSDERSEGQAPYAAAPYPTRTPGFGGLLAVLGTAGAGCAAVMIGRIRR
jgi:hypothetical protein